MRTGIYTIKPLQDILDITHELGYREDYNKNNKMFRIWKSTNRSNYTKYHVRSGMIKKMGDGKKYYFINASEKFYYTETGLSDMWCKDDCYFYCSWMLNNNFINENEFKI